MSVCFCFIYALRCVLSWQQITRTKYVQKNISQGFLMVSFLERFNEIRFKLKDF